MKRLCGSLWRAGVLVLRKRKECVDGKWIKSGSEWLLQTDDTFVVRCSITLPLPIDEAGDMFCEGCARFNILSLSRSLSFNAIEYMRDCSTKSWCASSMGNV